MLRHIPFWATSAPGRRKIVGVGCAFRNDSAMPLELQGGSGSVPARRACGTACGTPMLRVALFGCAAASAARTVSGSDWVPRKDLVGGNGTVVGLIKPGEGRYHRWAGHDCFGAKGSTSRPVALGTV